MMVLAAAPCRAQTPSPSPAVLGCLARYIKIANTPGVANMNWYELQAYNFAGTNVALNKPTSCLSVWNVANPASKGVDGVISEASYYNSQGTGPAEFWMVDLMTPQLLNRVVFSNRAVQTPSCWTPPAAWTAAGIGGGCDTRTINNTLTVYDSQNSTLSSALLTNALTQTFYMQCSASPTPTVTSTGTGTRTLTQTPTNSLAPGLSPSQTASQTMAPTATSSTSFSQTATPTSSMPVTGCFARYVRIENTPGVGMINFYELLAYNVSNGECQEHTARCSW